MSWKHLLYVIFSFSLYSNPIGLETIKGSATLEQSQGNLLIHASDGAVLHWKDFSIGSGELTQFLQPSETSWVLNRVVGNHSSQILGELIANGQIVLLNPHGILFGENAHVDIGGLIASTLNEGPIVNKGLIRARNGDVFLLGKTVECYGTIETSTKSFVRAEDNPYELVINFVKPQEACQIKEVNGRILLTSDEHTFVASDGTLLSRGINLLSDGITVFQGHAEVNNGFIDVSGKQGFYYQGTTDRKGGLLVLDPESDITISHRPFYNYSFEQEKPTADLSNISIDFLINEIQKGPITITTSYQGEGGGTGSIHIKDDVAHEYQSPYPLIFNCSGCGGIEVAGKIRNRGTGDIVFNSKEVSISGEVDGARVETQGFLKCEGKLYGKTLNIQSQNGGFISGKVIADGGPVTWFGGGTLSLKGGELGNGGNDSLTIQGLENVTLEENARLFTFSSNLSILDLSGALSLEGSTIYSGGPVTISGKEGAFHLNDGTLHTSGLLNVNLGRYLHCHNSLIQAEQPIALMLGSDLILNENSLMTSTQGITLNNKGSLLMGGTSTIRGAGVSLIVGESTSLLDASKIDGKMGCLSLTAAENLSMEGNRVSIESGQISIHVGKDLSIENHGKIASLQGPTTITAGNQLSLFEEGLIQTSGGNLDLSVTQGNLTLFGSSSLNSSTHECHIIVGKSLQMENFSSIKSLGEKGATIVIDQLGMGGGISMAPNSSISTGSCPLRIFTTSHHLNAIQGTLNGHYYVNELPLYLITSQDQWGTSYPNDFYAAPFTVFHKEDGLIQTSIGPVNHKTFIRHIVDYIGPFTAELFRDLHPYDEYIKESITFTDNHEPYFIRRKAKK